MKNIFLLFVLLLSFGIYNAEASSCKYTEKIKQCNEAMAGFLPKDNSFILPWSSIKSIDDFICLQDVPEKRILQIALDENFKKIDDEMDIYLKNLTAQKNLYFWKEAVYSYYDGLNHIWEKSEYFNLKYSNSCVTSLDETMDCMAKDDKNKSIWVASALEYLKDTTTEWTWECHQLIKIKIKIFNSIAYNTMLLNKQQVMRDQKKLYDQEIRTKYNKLLNLMMINLWYIERIWQKRPSREKNNIL